MKSDLCLAIGTELGEPSHYGKGRHWVDERGQPQLDHDRAGPAAIGVNRPIDVPLVGDLRAVVPQLVDGAEGLSAQPAAELDGWIKQDADQLAELAETAPSGRSPVHPAR